MMTREDWEYAARKVEDDAFLDPTNASECAWNMAIRAAARSLRREGLNAPWATHPPTEPSQ